MGRTRHVWLFGFVFLFFIACGDSDGSEAGKDNTLDASPSESGSDAPYQQDAVVGESDVSSDGMADGADESDGAAGAAGFVRPSSLAGSAEIGSKNYPIPTGAIFVASTGNDTTGTGTISNPYRTLGRAAAVVPSGGTILLRGGEYHEGGVYWRAEDSTPGGNATLGGVIFANSGITVQNYPGEAVWFDGSVVVDGWTFDGINWRKPFVTKFDHTPTHTRGQDASTWPGGGGFVNPSFPYAAHPEQLFKDGEQLEQVGGKSELGPGKFYVEGALYGGASVNKNVFITTAYVMRDNPTGHEMRISSLSRLTTINKPDMIFRGIGIRRYAPALVDHGAFYVGSAPGFQMEHCVVEDISVAGINQGAANATYRHLTIRRCGQLGLGAKKHSDGSTIEKCLFEKNVYQRFNYGPDAGDVKAVQVWNYNVRHNRFVDTFGHSLWFDMSCYMNNIYGNDFIRSYGFGVAYEISAKGYIVDNYFENVGLNSDLPDRPPHHSNPIWISGSNKCEIWNNTVVNSDQIIKIGQDYRTPTAPNSIDRYGRDDRWPNAFYDGSDPSYEYNGEMTWTVEKVTIKNNILYNPVGLNSVQSTFYTIGDNSDGVLRTRRNTADFGIETGGNLLNRLDSSKTPRFANGTRVVAGGIEIYWDMTGNAMLHPGNTSAPSWQALTGEIGSAFIDHSDATMTGAYPWTIKPGVLGAMTPQPLDSTVAERTDHTPGETSVGAKLE